MKKIFSLICCLFMFGCAHQEVFLNGQYVLQTDTNINIMFEGNNFAGSSGVNRYFGTYAVDANKIQINLAGSTMMMGPQDLMTAEQKYMTTLAKVTKLKLGKNRLILYVNSTDYLLFEKVK